MWVVVYMAADAAIAEALKAKLEEEGILVRLKPVYRKRANSARHQDVEVRVLRSEAAEAQQLLMMVNMEKLSAKREET